MDWIKERKVFFLGIFLPIGAFLLPPFITSLLSLILIMLSTLKWEFKGGLFSSLFSSLIMVIISVNVPAPYFTLRGLLAILFIYLVLGLTLNYSLSFIKDRQRQKNGDYKESQKSITYYERLLDSIHDPLHVIDSNMVIVYANREMRDQLQSLYRKQDCIGQSLFSTIPHLKSSVYEEYREVFETGKPLVTEELTEIEGESFYTETTKTPMFHEGGHVSFIVTIVRDITERKTYDESLLQIKKETENAHQSLLAVLNSMETGLYIVDMETYEVLFVNHYTEKIYGNIVGKKCWEVLHDDKTGPCSFCTNDRLLDNNGQPTGVYQWEFYNKKLGRWFQLHDCALHWFDGRLVRMEITIDITETKETRRRIEYQHKFQTMVANISHGFIYTPKIWIDEPINKALELIGDFFHVDRVYLFQFTEDGLYMSNTHEWCREGITPQRDTIQNVSIKDFPWILQEIHREEYVVISDTDQLIHREEREEFQRQDIESLLCMPLTVHEHVIGFFGMDSVSKKREWSEEEINLLKQIIGIIASALAKHQIERELEDRVHEIERLYHQLDQEIEKAHEIHKQILPEELPQIPGITFSSHYHPAEKIGGDFYDVMVIQKKLILYLSDVSGHGLDSAMLSLFIKHTIRGFTSFSSSRCITPERILHYLAKQYREENYPPEYFICIFVVVLDLETMEMKYSGAGFQDLPLVSMDSNQQFNLTSKGLFLTSFFPIEWLNLEEEKMVLTPGTTIFFNTDGFSEHGRPGAFYKDRLTEVFYRNAHLPTGHLHKVILDDFREFNNGGTEHFI